MHGRKNKKKVQISVATIRVISVGARNSTTPALTEEFRLLAAASAPTCVSVAGCYAQEHLLLLRIIIIIIITIVVVVKYRSREVGCNSSVSTVTRNVLGGPGIECRLGRDFPALGPTHPPVIGYVISFPEVKRPGRGVEHPPLSSSKVQKRIDLYRYSLICSYLVCCRGKFTFTFFVQASVLKLY
jgi:hypothetical protein